MPMIRTQAEKDAESAKHRPVKLALTKVQADALQLALASHPVMEDPSRERAALTYVQDHLRAAIRAAA